MIISYVVCMWSNARDEWIIAAICRDAASALDTQQAIEYCGGIPTKVWINRANR